MKKKDLARLVSTQADTTSADAGKAVKFTVGKLLKERVQ